MSTRIVTVTATAEGPFRMPIAVTGFTPPAVAPPTGTGIYTYAQTGQTSVQAAATWVGSKGGKALVMPSGTFPLVPNFSPSTFDVVGFPTGVSLYGAGKDHTIFTLAGTFTLAASAITGTNPYHVFKWDGADAPIVLSDFTLDCSGTWGNIFGGIRLRGQTNALVQRVNFKAVPGSMNYPPGETFALNLYNCNNTNIIDCEVDGAKVGAAGFGGNDGGNHFYTRCYSHDSGHSMGFTMYKVAGATFRDCIAANNGTGTGSSTAAGFNHEESTGPMIHYNSVAYGNSYCGARFEAGANGGVNRTDHALYGVNFTGSPDGIRCQNLQTSVPLIDAASYITGTSERIYIGA